MGRPPTPVGHYGNIKTKEIVFTTPDGKSGKRYEARTLFRMADGSLKDVMRTGSTKQKAIDRLKERLTILATEAHGSDITPDTRMVKIAALWLEDIERQARLGTLADETARIYGNHLAKWILPALGELLAREVRAMTVDRVIQNAQDKRSAATARGVRAVLSNLCTFAVRHGAMSLNPVRSASRLAEDDGQEVVAMSLEQRLDLGAKLRDLGRGHLVDSRGHKLGERALIWQLLPDIYESMLATGVRIGELLALTGDEIDPAAREVAIDYHIVRVRGQGLMRKSLRKGRKAGIVLRVPDWSVPMWRRLKLASGGGPIFRSAKGGWMSPSNVVSNLRKAFDECGYEWVTSHVFRKTVATVLDQADLPTTAIADQLGNSPAMVNKHYRARRVANPASASALEGMLKPEEGAS